MDAASIAFTPLRVRSKRSDPRCCAFLAKRTSELCSHAGKEEVSGLIYCMMHAKCAKKKADNNKKVVIETLSRFADETKPLDDEDECAICQDVFGKKGDRTFLECGHAFHPECLGTWFAKDKSSCPNCRTVSVRGKVASEVGEKFIGALLRLATQLDATHIAAVKSRMYIEKFKSILDSKPKIEDKEAEMEHQMKRLEDVVIVLRGMNLL